MEKTRCIKCRNTQNVKMIEGVDFFRDAPNIGVCESCVAHAIDLVLESCHIENLVDGLSPFEAIEEDYNLKNRVIHYLKYGVIKKFF